MTGGIYKHGFVMDFGESNLYSGWEMRAALEVIFATFERWAGCSMLRLAFTDDRTCIDDVAYLNELREEGAPVFDQAIVFTSDFHSPSEKEAEGTAWEPDAVYEGWTWHLGRTDSDGARQLMTWGYA